MLNRKTKIFLWVLLAHLMLLLLIILISSPSSKEYYSSPVTSVDLIEPIEVSSIMEEVKPPPEPEPPEPPPPEEPEVKKKPPAPPKKIIKKVSPLKLPPSNLKKRLQDRLSRIKSTAPRQTTERPAISASRQDRFPYSWYNNFVQSKMYSLWSRPAKAVVKKEAATSLVSFRVYRDGHIETIRLKESSGSAIMDESTLQAVRMADPLPPLPQGFKGSYEDFIILFELAD
ncbi:MAG: TonB family protein [Candidatus Euphemobacter frigidus]|nr:TonB family protein [Candidatus Euphemobacter frigidus]MDP8275507.1 TonB family protein [Candidatus Euphemobacter frigidus]